MAIRLFSLLLCPSTCLHDQRSQILSFHKRMSIVTDTLSRASVHLDHFIFVMILVRDR